MPPATYPNSQRATSSCPYSVLLRVGFTKQASHLASGALLPHRFILTRFTPGGLFSVALSLGSPPLDVIQHPALCSSDFPQMSPFGLTPAVILPTRAWKIYYHPKDADSQALVIGQYVIICGEAPPSPPLPIGPPFHSMDSRYGP